MDFENSVIWRIFRARHICAAAKAQISRDADGVYGHHGKCSPECVDSHWDGRHYHRSPRLGIPFPLDVAVGKRVGIPDGISPADGRRSYMGLCRALGQLGSAVRVAVCAGLAENDEGMVEIEKKLSLLIP